MANERLRIDIQANDKASKTINNVNKAMTRVSGSTRRSGQAFTQLAYALDDAQYGFRGVQNNIQQLAVTMGVGGPWVLAITAATIAFGFLIGKLADSEDAAWNLGDQIKTLKSELDDLTSQLDNDDRTLEQKIIDKWDEILDKQSQYLGFWEGLQTSANVAGFGSAFESLRELFGVDSESLGGDITSGNSKKKEDSAAAKKKKEIEDLKKANKEYHDQYISNLDHAINLERIYGAEKLQLYQMEFEALLKIDTARLTDEQIDKIQKRLEVLQALMSQLEGVTVTASKTGDAMDRFAGTVAGALAQAGSSGENFAANFGSSILNAIGGFLVAEGIAAIASGKTKVASGFFAGIGLDQIKAGWAEVGIGAALKAGGSAINRSSYGGGGSSGATGRSVSYTSPNATPTQNQGGGGDSRMIGELKLRGQDLIVALQSANRQRNTF